MKELYLIPSVEIVKFDAKDVITTSGGDLSNYSGTTANAEEGWSGLY